MKKIDYLEISNALGRVIRFGTHKDKMLGHVPKKYLLWLADNVNANGRFYKQIRLAIKFHPGETLTYQDVTIQTEAISERPLQYDGMQIRCCRVGGWELWSGPTSSRSPEKLAGEFGDNWLVIKVNGVTICDSRKEK